MANERQNDKHTRDAKGVENSGVPAGQKSGHGIGLSKQGKIAEGKTKTLYETDDARRAIVEFRDDITGFDGKKHQRLARKGAVNNAFNTFIMRCLETGGVRTHLIGRFSASEALVHRLEMMPVEFVVRNLAAGSLCAKLGVAEGRDLEPPIFQLFLKDDERGDPMINQSVAISLGLADARSLERAWQATHRVNEILRPLFFEAGLLLVDYKLEFGLAADGTVFLGDEFTPDGCRLWHRETREKLDKDRFRQDLGDVVESYELAARMLGIDNDFGIVSAADLRADAAGDKQSNTADTRRDAGAAEQGGLENRCALTGAEGSNPSLSATDGVIVLDGKRLAAESLRDQARRVEQAKKQLASPTLATILVGDDPASATYVRMKGEACRRVGLQSRAIELPASVQTDELLACIEELNADQQVLGILLQHPVSAHIDERACFDAIAAHKDVDGVSCQGFGRLSMGVDAYAAATPAGIMRLLAHYDIALAGQHAVVVGRSPILGKPMAMMLLNANATVSVCHSKTRDLRAHVARADVLIACVGQPRFIPAAWLRSGSVVVDAGYHPAERCGDVDLEPVKETLRAYTPVPGGVGPMTINTLIDNTVRAMERRAQD